MKVRKILPINKAIDTISPGPLVFMGRIKNSTNFCVFVSGELDKPKLADEVTENV